MTDGIKTIYIKFRSPTGGTSERISAGIELVSGEIQAPEEPEEPWAGNGCVQNCDKITYSVYIVNPDGTIRSMENGFAKRGNIGFNKELIYFEDSGTDMDFNDVVIEVDRTDCLEIKVRLVSIDAAWHHQVKIKLFLSGVLKVDAVVAEDSQLLATMSYKTISIRDYPNLCEAAPDDTEVFVDLFPGDLIKASLSAVYYYGQDQQRYVFPNQKIYMSWYDDFLAVKTISDAQLAGLPIGGNVTYRPGDRMIKLQIVPTVYAVDAGGVLRWVTTEAAAVALYGRDWAAKIDDLSDAFFFSYTVGEPIEFASDFSPVTVMYKVPNIAVDKGFEKFETITENSGCAAEIQFTKYMKKGDQNQDVLALHRLLKCLGYIDAGQAITDYFGDITESAVKEFQYNHNIEPVGDAGQITREELNTFFTGEIIRKEIHNGEDEVITECSSDYLFTQDLVLGQQNNEILEMQKILKCLGYIDADQAIAGYFGTITKNALIAFQSDYSIIESGAVGAETRGKLNSF